MQRRMQKQAPPPVTVFWRLRPVPPALPTPTWRLRTWRIREEAGNCLKAETDGSGGAECAHKGRNCSGGCIIIAADKNVEMARFDGKPVIMVPVADGIHKAEELIKRAVDGTVPVYHHTGAAGGESVSEGLL